MVKLLRNGMHHPRGEMHFSRGRGFPRFPIQPPHLMVQQMPSGNHDHFPHSVPPYLPPSSRGRLFPGPVPPPQFAHNPHCPVPPPGMGPFMPRGGPQISRGGPHIFPNHRSFPPKPIPPQHPISPGPHRGDLGSLGQEQRIFSNQNSGQSFIRKPDSVKRLGVVNGKRKQKRKSKPKERSEDLFFCEACDRGWKTEEALKIHLSEHRTCGLEGCTLSAHPKVIENHILQQHVTGLYKRITTSSNPNDFAKWIAERKSRFPTTANIKKKQAQKEEMLARGERMPQNEKSKRPRDDQSFNRGRGGKRRRQRRKREDVNQEPEVKDEQEQESTPGFKFLKVDKSWEDNWRGDLPQFPGTAAFPEIKEEIVDAVEEEQFSDDEWQSGGSKVISVQPLLMSQALASLCGTYASGSDNDDEEEPIATKKQTTCPTVVKEEIHCDVESGKNDLENTENTNIEFMTDNKEKSDSDSGPDEAPIGHENNFEEDVKDSLEITEEKNIDDIHERSEQTKLSRKSVNTGTKRSTNTRFTQRRRRLTLLEKLLSSEIRHERNVILQCVRYVVQNNFFSTK